MTAEEKLVHISNFALKIRHTCLFSGPMGVDHMAECIFYLATMSDEFINANLDKLIGVVDALGKQINKR